MKRENILLGIVIILASLAYAQFTNILVLKEQKSELKYERDQYKKAYLKANTVNKHLDSIHLSGLIINLSSHTKEQLDRKLKAIDENN